MNFFMILYLKKLDNTLKASQKILANLKYRLNDFLLISKNISLKESDEEKIKKKMLFFKLKKIIPKGKKRNRKKRF